MMNQMMQNPQMMQSMMSSPYMQDMMRQMSSNPEIANQMIRNNPLFSSNPQMADQLRQNLPQMMEQVCFFQWLPLLYGFKCQRDPGDGAREDGVGK